MYRLFNAILFIIIFSAAIMAQTYESKWGLGVGGIYPRFFSVSGTAVSGNENYGMYVSIEKYFNKSLALRLLGNYIQMESEYVGINPGLQTQTLNQLAASLDVLYRFSHCDLISPYFLVGIGLTSFNSENPLNKDFEDNFVGYQANLGIGVDWGLTENFSIKTEATYITASNNKIDGNDRINENTKGLFGGNGDTYMTFNAGVVWYFSLGERSDICDKSPQGIRETIVRDTVVIEKVNEVEKIIDDTVYIEKPFLFGVHFEFGKYDLKPESFPILEHAIDVLNQHKKINIVITGHTDNYGSNQYNDKLSEQRVNTIYNYLISKGVNSNRIQKGWFGEDKPIRDNDSDLNRAFNRRVEIKVLDK
jgi:OOP family OmpA-OmpF porin